MRLDKTKVQIMYLKYQLLHFRKRVDFKLNVQLRLDLVILLLNVLPKKK